MICQVKKYFDKLTTDGSAEPSHVAVVARDDEILSTGAEDFVSLATKILKQLNVVALVVAAPPFAFLEVLLQRMPPDSAEIIPLDTETRTFLHDIPVVRAEEFNPEDPSRLIALLGQRKGVLVEGVGIVATGTFTVEMAYINYSSVYHALYVKTLLDFLQQLAPNREELRTLTPLWNQLAANIPDRFSLAEQPLDTPDTILAAIDETGRKTVSLRLVDSFFGNISCRYDNALYISQTGASLDELAGCIDLVTDGNVSTAGITASSELVAHRAVYRQSDALTIVHGHPKLTVTLSLLCEEQGCRIEDCWKDCDRVRLLGGHPLVAGEVGAGGIARKVPPVIGRTGTAIVYGHGVFATGRSDFSDPLRTMIQLENFCRQEYLHRLNACLNSADRDFFATLIAS